MRTDRREWYPVWVGLLGLAIGVYAAVRLVFGAERPAPGPGPSTPAMTIVCDAGDGRP
jgi:hypothetical protein